MIVRCPSCGADVEFRYDDSFVRVCSHCRAAVVRGDRGVETLGAFADLAPIDSPLRLFAEGHYGTTGFLVIGMAQLRHAAGGVWQEWYAKLDGGAWAWISEAQGRLYFTLERPDLAVPSIAELAPGTRLELAGAAFTVAERGTATYVAALGEIPYRLAPNTSFQFADLGDGRGGFATIDYGDGGEPPVVYLGTQVAPQALGLVGGEAAVTRATAAPGARLACPNCNGALELRAPDHALRVACPYCNSLVSVEGGTLSIIAAQAAAPAPAIALGSRGRFVDGELTVIGHVARSACVDATWWPFEEYLLYGAAVGFRWLVCSEGHWSYVQPIATGAVNLEPGVSYDGVAFRRFQAAPLRVDRVVGEFYWRVEVGERVTSEDYIAPPAMLSREVSATEQHWSLASYLTAREVRAAFGTPLALPPATGVAPNQPYPAGIGKTIAVAFVALGALGIGKCASAPEAEQLRQGFRVPAASAIAAVAPVAPTSPPLPTTAADALGDTAATDPSGAVTFSPKFALEAGRNIEFELAASLTNDWLYAVVDLIDDDTGSVVSFDKSIEYYAGTDSDGSWDEGSRRAREVIGPVAAGTYLLRVESQHGGAGTIDLTIAVRQGVFRGAWFWLFAGALALAFGSVGIHAARFGARRWSASNISAPRHAAPGDDDD